MDASVEAFLTLGAGPHRHLKDVDPDVVDRLRRMATTTMSKHTAGEPDHVVPVRDTWERVGRIGVPVLAINGAADSPDHLAMAERLAGAVPRGRSMLIDGTAHYPNMERPDLFTKALEHFLHTL
ncbi:alpha/beta hydrolase [Sphaerisporangium sp. TRM90804]|uniref:alpha/beta fold hydrolase n=1 Tax=Sphaerisporangium sp. TRM90804 TaxID=3031113 RepID=UPI002449EC03|nr:alpha/beta hydrolase [Sphaerisporangium sp. TRM90804]MDH2430803.1 alpha/beta hydrolase [Sphaerisporangium sp. TRM90804]